jgi:thiamine transporter ThiT
MFIVGPIIGIVTGLITGTVTLIAGKFIKPAQA